MHGAKVRSFGIKCASYDGIPPHGRWPALPLFLFSCCYSCQLTNHSRLARNKVHSGAAYTATGVIPNPHVPQKLISMTGPVTGL